LPHPFRPCLAAACGEHIVLSNLSDVFQSQLHKGESIMKSTNTNTDKKQNSEEKSAKKRRQHVYDYYLSRRFGR
ncbi:hypothetical protein, partial [Vibrio anguillarum]|uniref:hypothetical protein n=1 Tax=Vibrio anguillarum TaxID=55601 RepID=UPI001BE4AACE